MKPIALRAKEGLGALIKRSESEPPIHRNQPGKQPPSKSGVPPKTGDSSNNESGLLPGNGIHEKVDVSHLDLHTRPTNRPFNSYLSERTRKVVPGDERNPRVVTPISVKGKGFKSSPLPAEVDITDEAKNKGMSSGTREGGASASLQNL